MSQGKSGRAPCSICPDDRSPCRRTDAPMKGLPGEDADNGRAPGAEAAVGEPFRDAVSGVCRRRCLASWCRWSRPTVGTRRVRKSILAGRVAVTRSARPQRACGRSGQGGCPRGRARDGGADGADTVPVGGSDRLVSCRPSSRLISPEGAARLPQTPGPLVTRRDPTGPMSGALTISDRSHSGLVRRFAKPPTFEPLQRFGRTSRAARRTSRRRSCRNFASSFRPERGRRAVITSPPWLAVLAAPTGVWRVPEPASAGRRRRAPPGAHPGQLGGGHGPRPPLALPAGRARVRRVGRERGRGDPVGAARGD